MSDLLGDALVFATLVGSALVGGVFFAFSTFVMRALARVPTAEGIRAMQMINVTVLNRWFLGVFFGTAVCGGLLAIGVLLGPGTDGALLAGLAGAAYLIGTFGVTVVCNVPRNEALARLDANSPTSAAAWAEYLRTWTAWNHVRTLAAVVSVGLLAMAI